MSFQPSVAMARAGGLIVLVTLGFLLGGCSAQSSTLAGLSSGSVAFTVCDAIAADTIAVTKFNAVDESTAEFTEVWVLSGKGQSLQAGSVVVLGEAPPGYTVEVPYLEGSLDLAEDGVQVSLLQVGGNNDVSQFELADLTTGFWIDSVGAEYTDPC